MDTLFYNVHCCIIAFFSVTVTQEIIIKSCEIHSPRLQWECRLCLHAPPSFQMQCTVLDAEKLGRLMAYA